MEEDIDQKIPKGSNIIAGMVRWAAELISKYSVGCDGKSSYERIRQERSKVPIAMFGEVALYLPLETANALKEQAQPKMRMGIWLGTIERTEESLIGTEKGVVKCRPPPGAWSPRFSNQFHTTRQLRAGRLGSKPGDSRAGRRSSRCTPVLAAWTPRAPDAKRLWYASRPWLSAQCFESNCMVHCVVIDVTRCVWTHPLSIHG